MKKGEKYIIEIAEVKEHCDDNGKAFPLARIKGFSSLVFDQKGLDKLEKVNGGEPCKKPLKCRFICLKDVLNHNGVIILTQGKIYEVKNGKFKDELGYKFPITFTLYTQEGLADFMADNSIDIVILKD